MLERTTRMAIGRPRNLLTEFFTGEVEGWGLVLTRFGSARRRYGVKTTGSWSGQTFILDELFTFDNEKIDERSWSFTFGEGGAVTGECSDLAGVATGSVMVAELRLDYVFNVPFGKLTLPLRFDDRMYRIDDKTMGGHAVMKKFGIRVGEMFTLFRRL